MGLNREQQLAVDCNDKKILCLAGAGTGKTFSMISRIERLINDGISPLNILVLTFTEKAAFEMTERYTKNHKGAISPKFCTFHSFCYSLIIENSKIRKELGYSAPPNVIDENEYKQIMSRLKLKLGLKISDKKLFGKEFMSMKEKSEFEILQKAFKNELKKQNLITFDLMCYSICELFKNNNSLVDSYKERYKYVFVDEFQDTDPKQYDFICSFKDSNLFVVGDIQQSIYGFRGADSSIIKSLADSSDWTTIKLIHNYRSTKQICDYSNHICQLDANYVIALEADKDGPEVQSKLLPSSEIKKVLRDTILKSCLSGTTAILVRTNSEVKTIRSLLASLKICYTTNSNTLEDAEDVLKCCVDNDYALKYLSAQLSSNKYSEYMRLSIYDEKYLNIDEFLKLYLNDYNVAKVYSLITQIRNILKQPFKTPYQKCMEICGKLRLSNKDIKLSGSTNEDIINSILNSNAEETAYDLYVGTIHSSKGLEYDNVLVFGVAGDKFKLTNEENRNIYYVACTRAKENLFVFRGDIEYASVRNF